MKTSPTTGATTRATKEALAEAIAALRERLGERLSTSMAVRRHHGQDVLSYHPTQPPDAVAFAQSTEEVAAIVGVCGRHHVSVIPFGTGTAVEGQVIAVQGGICIDLSGMDEVLEVHAEDMDCTVRAGVTRNQLNTHLRDTGLFFPVDPGADASLGGMAATRASGTNAVRYGTMRENVLALTVVLADGRVIRTARRARKSAAGYDLTRLFVGSEGTLGVITEVTLRLHGIPEAVSAAVCNFADVDAAVDAVIQTIQSGIPIARIELLDALQMDAVNRYSSLDYALRPTFFLEFHGTEAGVKEQAEAVQAIAAEKGGSDFQWATDAEERDRLWQARHDLGYACLAYRPGSKMWATDVCVPISRLADCVRETRLDLDDTDLVAPMVGHVGDGNFHVAVMVDPDDDAEVEAAQAFNRRLIARALDMDGTCTGEHGVGVDKIDFLVDEHGEAMSIMRRIKRSLDPDNIMNPGKMLRMD